MNVCPANVSIGVISGSLGLKLPFSMIKTAKVLSPQPQASFAAISSGEELTRSPRPPKSSGLTLHILALTWSHGFRESDCGIASGLNRA